MDESRKPEETQEQTAPGAAEALREEAPAPFLSSSFFSKLVKQPPCMTKGVCNNCGRCEH